MRGDIVDILDLLGLERADFVRTSYRIMLGRWPEARELSAHATALCLGRGRRRLLVDIASSREYEIRQKALLAAGDDADCIRRVYEMFVGRLPDPEESEGYRARLLSGQSRDLISREIARSDEARSSGTLDSDISRLVAEERKNSGLFGRWFGQARRRARARNCDLEVAYRHNAKREKGAAAAEAHGLAITRDIATVRRSFETDSEYFHGQSQSIAEHIKILISKTEEMLNISNVLKLNADDMSGRSDKILENIEKYVTFHHEMRATLAKMEVEYLHKISDFIRKQQPKTGCLPSDVDETDMQLLGQRGRGAMVRLQRFDER